MVNFKLKNFKITGISTVVPETEKLLTDNPNLYNGNERKIKRLIESSGFYKRRVTDESTMTSDMCLQAANDLIKNLKINKDEIDGLIFVSYTPDYLMPATSYVLHKKLELSQNCVVMDIPQACSGYVIGLLQAGMLLNSGCKKVLLLVGDSFSKFTDMFSNNTAPVFGDAGSATLLEYDEKVNLSYFSVNSDGTHWDALCCLNGGFKNPPKQMQFKDDEYIYNSSMDGGRIFDFTMNNISDSIKNLLDYAKIDKSEIDKFLFHQANKFIIENIAEKLSIEKEKYSTETLTNYGNQCGASIPCSISNSFREIAIEGKKQYLLSGFGVGLSWANAIIELDQIYCSRLNNYMNIGE